MRVVIQVLLLLIVLTATSIAQSGGNDLPHRTDFLTFPQCQRGTTFYPNATVAEREVCRSALVARGYTHLYLSVTSERSDWFIDSAGFRIFLQELRDSGILPVVFLTSDTGIWKDQSISAIKDDLAAFIPQVDDLVSSYVLGLEIDEYWTYEEADAIGLYLQLLTAKPIGVHQLPAKWDYCQRATWCDQMLLQYGFGRTPSQVRRMTIRAIRNIGKPVVAAEYSAIDESVSILLGDAAVAAGASGFGNGGTPSLLSCPCGF